MKFPWQKPKEERRHFFATFGSEQAISVNANAIPSSLVDNTYAGYQYVLQPEVPFKTQYEYYTTIGRVQAAVDNYVAEVKSRDWYFDGPKEGVEIMEAWVDEFNQADSRLIEYMVRDWLICGNNIIGTTDWQPVQMDSVVGLKRDVYGNVSEYVQQVTNGRWQKLPLSVDQYIHTKYIEINRKPWGIGMFHALTTAFDWNGKRSTPQLELLRRHYQNAAQAEERYAWPLNLWGFVATNDAEFEKQKQEMKAWKPGERRFFAVGSKDEMPVLQAETIDGARSGLLQTTSEIIDEETAAGLQSTGTRLRTKPSAMADAREARAEDDVILLGIMESVRRTFNAQIIPRVIRTNRQVEFKFGQQDQFDLQLGELLQLANVTIDGKPVISIQEFRNMIGKIGVPLDNTEYNKFLQSQADAQAKTKRDHDLMLAQQRSAFFKSEPKEQ